jgi:tetratricopeptide (TPR) repeat protein
MSRFRTTLGIAIAVVVLAAILIWPTYAKRGADAAHAASLPTMAPVTTDYKDRGKLIAFWEGAVKAHHTSDMLSPRQLAEQYLQRYREEGDIDDVFRAQRMARMSLAAMPRGNIGADVMLASVDLTLHNFKHALAETKFIESYDPGDPQMKIREASLDLELGDYTAAGEIIHHLAAAKSYAGIPRDTIESRYDELTGHLSEGRSLLERATAYENSQFDLPAQSRAWFYFRSGEMAFEAGDNDAAIAFEKQATSVFPTDVDALRAEARFECALHRWHECLASATASANVIPYPETLGYEVDAQRALGDKAAADRTNDLIETVERIGNAQHISDRLLAIYYSEHGIRLADAYVIAKRELAVRDDIFTEDTLAWAAAMDGKWNEARTRSAKAMRFDTEISLLQYHAGVIAEHFGDRRQAKRRFEKALALNPSFHQTYAEDARNRLAGLAS